MEANLLKEVQIGINARKGDWRKIAAAVPGVSYSWISQVGRGVYRSEPSYSRLMLVAEYLKSSESVKVGASDCGHVHALTIDRDTVNVKADAGATAPEPHQEAA